MPEVDASAEPELDVPLADIRAAAERLSGLVHRTPVLSSATAAAWVRVATGASLRDDRLYLKAEHLQKTGSFKARGMTNRIATLAPEARDARRHHALRRERGAGLCVGRTCGRGAGHGRDARRCGSRQGRRVPRLRRAGRPPRRARRRDLRGDGADLRRRGTHVRAPVRRPGGDRRPWHSRAGAPRGGARPRRARGRGRRGRADLRGRCRGQGHSRPASG